MLEIAEQILEDRRKKKKKRKRVLTYSSTSNSEHEEEENVHLRNCVQINKSACSDEHSLVVNRKRKRVPTVLSESESDGEGLTHKHLINSNSEHNKVTSECNNLPDKLSNNSSVSSGSKSGELFYKPTLSKLLRSKLKH